MSVFNFKGYLAPPRQSLGGELIGFNKRTGQPVQAAAGMHGLGSPDGLGSYLDLSPDFYQTYQHENWQHPGSSGWSKANMPGWGNNPNLQMFDRRGMGGLYPHDVEYPIRSTRELVSFMVGGVLGYIIARKFG